MVISLTASLDETAIPFRIIQEGKVDLTDLRILKKLLEGKSLKDVSSEVGVAEKTVANRLAAMEKNEVILKKGGPIVDILHLYNYFFVAFVKLHLGAAIPEGGGRTHPITGAPMPPTPAPPSWLEVLDTMKRIDKELFAKIVRYAFVTMGTEYDIMLIISTQSIEEYTRFFSQLQRKGFIEKVWGHTVVSYAGYHYDPIAIPDPDEVEAGLRRTGTFLAKQKGLDS